jgi:hypothetical protein
LSFLKGNRRLSTAMSTSGHDSDHDEGHFIHTVDEMKALGQTALDEESAQSTAFSFVEDDHELRNYDSSDNEHHKDAYEDDFHDRLSLTAFLKLSSDKKEKLTKSGNKLGSVATRRWSIADTTTKTNKGKTRRDSVHSLVVSDLDFEGTEDLSLSGDPWAHHHVTDETTGIALVTDGAALLSNDYNEVEKEGSSGSLLVDLYVNSSDTMEAMADSHLLDYHNDQPPHDNNDEDDIDDDEEEEGEYNSSITDFHNRLHHKLSSDAGISTAKVSPRRKSISDALSSISTHAPSEKRGKSKSKSMYASKEDTFRADFIAQRALLKKVAKDHVNLHDELSSHKQELEQQHRRTLLSRMMFLVKGQRIKIRQRLLLKKWGQWHRFLSNIDVSDNALLQGRYESMCRALVINKKRRLIRAWYSVISAQKNAYSRFVKECDRLRCRFMRIAYSQWRSSVSKESREKTEFNYIIVSLRKRFAAMRSTNISTKLAFKRLHAHALSMSVREKALKRVLAFTVERASYMSMAFRKWRYSLIFPAYTIGQEVNYNLGFEKLQAVMHFNAIRKEQSCIHRHFHQWLLQVQYWNNKETATYTSINSLFATIKHRWLKHRFHVWYRNVQFLKTRITRFKSILTLLKRKQVYILKAYGIRKWKEEYLFKMNNDSIYSTIAKYNRNSERRSTLIAEALYTQREESQSLKTSFLLQSCFRLWKSRNFSHNKRRAKQLLLSLELMRRRWYASNLFAYMIMWKKYTLLLRQRDAGMLRVTIYSRKQSIKMALMKWNRYIRLQERQWRIVRWIYILIDKYSHMYCFRYMKRWRQAVSDSIRVEKVCHGLYHVIKRAWIRRWLRHWQGKVNASYRYNRDLHSKQSPFIRWQRFRTFSLQRKTHWRYSMYILIQRQQYFYFKRWSSLYRKGNQKRLSMDLIIRLYHINREGRLRRAFAHWRVTDTRSSSDSIRTLGTTLSKSLQRLVMVEDEKQGLVTLNSLQESQIFHLKKKQEILYYNLSEHWSVPPIPIAITMSIDAW